MRCRIGGDRYIAGVCFAIIGCYLNRVSSCFQTDRSGNLATIHFNNNIGQTVWRYNERNRIDSLCDKMNILIKCKMLGSAGKQVDFCSFRVYGFCIVQMIAIRNCRHIVDCRDIDTTRILCINLCFFHGESAVTSHRVFTFGCYFGTAFDQNIAWCPYGAIRSRGAFYLASVNRQLASGIQTGIKTCCLDFGCNKLYITTVSFIIFPDICSVTIIFSCHKCDIGAVCNLQPIGVDSGVSTCRIHDCIVNLNNSIG